MSLMGEVNMNQRGCCVVLHMPMFDVGLFSFLGLIVLGQNLPCAFFPLPQQLLECLCSPFFIPFVMCSPSQMP